MNILFVTSEAVPFIKTGGLADVAGALPKSIKKLGHDIRVVLPRYYDIDKDLYNLKKLPNPLGVPMGVLGEKWCSVYEGRLPNSRVKVYFIEHEHYFGRSGVYNDQFGEGFCDNDHRFVFFSRAALQLSKMLDFSPDVVHCNDWQSGAIPVMLNTIYKNDKHLGGSASMLTIHNLAYQGVFFKGLIDVLETGWETFTFKEFEYHDNVNLLKGGISNATVLTTVSEKYAKEIQTPAFGYGLDELLSSRYEFLRGIVNGVDYKEWSSKHDPFITKNFTYKSIEDKKICKKDLQEEFGLKKRDVPLFGLVTRLADQKGLDILIGSFERILSLDIQVVLIGSGDKKAEEFFIYMAHKYPEKFACHIGYNNSLAHKVEAGGDFFIMPSKFEPCGLNQIYSLAYGTLPIVKGVGGLDDTVENFNEETNTGTGFKFYQHTTDALFDTIGWATHTWYNNKKAIKKLQKNAFKVKFDWKKSALEYEEEYKRAVYLKSL